MLPIDSFHKEKIVAGVAGWAGRSGKRRRAEGWLGQIGLEWFTVLG